MSGPRRGARGVGRYAVACAVACGAASACASRIGAVYPPRPPATPAAALAEPAPARVVTHLTVTGPALRAALDEAVPRTGDGTFQVMGANRTYRWTRPTLDVAFAHGRIAVDARVDVHVDMPFTALDFPLDVRVSTEPVLTSEYVVKLQAPEVKVTSSDSRMAVADIVGGIYGLIGAQVGARLRDFAFDLRPLLGEAKARIARPIDLPLGDAHGCAELRILGVEASPTLIADGIEKDLALVVAPSVTFPCAAAAESGALPPLSNVSTLVPGPFTVTVPIAARYDELTKAMTLAFTDGRYHFSKEYPGLYLSDPEVYASDDKLVLKMRLRGPVDKGVLSSDLDGDIFLSGHPQVIDNELTLPDLEPTIETKSLLLQIKAMTDSDSIRDEARRALRLDIGARIKPITEKLSTELAFGSDKGCFRGAVDKVEVTSVHAHATYLRVYVAVTARTSLHMPCGRG